MSQAYLNEESSNAYLKAEMMHREHAAISR